MGAARPTARGLALLGCGLLFGCAEHTDAGHSTPAASPHDRAHGVVEGRVVRSSGRDPRHGGMLVGVSGDHVRVRGPGGQAAASAVTGPDGRFRLVLPPGAYRITEDMCAVSGRVEVRAGVTVSLTLRMLHGTC